MKFAIFDDISKININLLKDFLNANNISYLDVRLIPSYTKRAISLGRRVNSTIHWWRPFSRSVI